MEWSSWCFDLVCISTPSCFSILIPSNHVHESLRNFFLPTNICLFLSLCFSFGSFLAKRHRRLPLDEKILRLYGLGQLSRERKVTFSDDGAGRLSVSSITAKYTGQYVCIANNSLGLAVQCVHVNVTGTEHVLFYLVVVWLWQKWWKPSFIGSTGGLFITTEELPCEIHQELHRAICYLMPVIICVLLEAISGGTFIRRADLSFFFCKHSKSHTSYVLKGHGHDKYRMRPWSLEWSRG